MGLVKDRMCDPRVTHYQCIEDDCTIPAVFSWPFDDEPTRLYPLCPHHFMHHAIELFPYYGEGYPIHADERLH
jgi:hypothetical protein